jgi:hypothetical protein
MGDEVHRVVARHVALGEEIGRMALAFGKQGDQNIGTRHFLASGILDVDDGALDHALEAGRRLGVLVIVDDQFGQFIVDVFGQGGAKLIQIDIARLHHGAGVLIVHEREEKVLQGGKFMPTLIGVAQSAVQAVFEI